MRKHIALATATILATGVSAAGLNALHAGTPSTEPADRLAATGDATGMIVQIDPMGEVISVDGVDYMVPDHVSIAGLEVGDEVTVRFADSDIPGQYVLTEILAGNGDLAAAGTDPARTAERELEDGVVTPGEATGVVQQVDEVGNIIVVDGVRYLLEDTIDVADIAAGELVTVSFEESELGTELLATEVVPAVN